jgi:hypothetical protein
MTTPTNAYAPSLIAPKRTSGVGRRLRGRFDLSAAEALQTGASALSAATHASPLAPKRHSRRNVPKLVPSRQYVGERPPERVRCQRLRERRQLGRRQRDVRRSTDFAIRRFRTLLADCFPPFAMAETSASGSLSAPARIDRSSSTSAGTMSMTRSPAPSWTSLRGTSARGGSRAPSERQRLIDSYSREEESREIRFTMPTGTPVSLLLRPGTRTGRRE